MLDAGTCRGGTSSTVAFRRRSRAYAPQCRGISTALPRHLNARRQRAAAVRPACSSGLAAQPAVLEKTAGKKGATGGDGGGGPSPPPTDNTSKDDKVKEQSRAYRRTVFTFDSWTEHRSKKRYWRHMQGMASSRMVRGLAAPLAYLMGVAAVVVGYEFARKGGMLPVGAPALSVLGSESPFQVASFALSLLLVFRTNSSYSRWLDARKTWGLVTNRSRDIMRQGLTWMDPQKRMHERTMLCRWTPAFSRSLMCHLTRDGDLAHELESVLLPVELEQVMASKHRPLYILQLMSALVRDGTPNGAGWYVLGGMEGNLTQLEDCVGTCERILKTPIPLSYTRHTSRFMIIWLTLLPLTLVERCGWATVPIIGLISFLLLGIEEIGVSIEEPFSILPLAAMCDTILDNSRELEATHCNDSKLPSADGSPPLPMPAGQLVAHMAGRGAALENGAGPGH